MKTDAQRVKQWRARVQGVVRGMVLADMRERGWTVEEICASSGMSRQSFLKWNRLYAARYRQREAQA